MQNCPIELGRELWRRKAALPNLRSGFEEVKKELGVSKTHAHRLMAAVKDDPEVQALLAELESRKATKATSRGKRRSPRVDRQNVQEAPTIHLSALRFALWHAVGVLFQKTDFRDIDQRDPYYKLRNQTFHYQARTDVDLEAGWALVRKIGRAAEGRPDVPGLPPSKTYYEVLMERMPVPHAVTHEESASSASPYDSRTWEVLG